MPIDHLQATDEHLAERYLLQEMSTDEAEDFERHFFECEACASAVEAGEILRANGQAVVAEGWKPVARTATSGRASEPRQSLWEFFLSWLNKRVVLLPVAASLVLGALALYQGAVVIPGLRQARVLPAFQLIGASRGETSQIRLPHDAAFFAVSVDIPPDAKYPQYIFEFLSEGHTIAQLLDKAPTSGEGITLQLSTRNFHPGQFQLLIFGAGSDGQRQEKVSSSSFDLRILP